MPPWDLRISSLIRQKAPEKKKCYHPNILFPVILMKAVKEELKGFHPLSGHRKLKRISQGFAKGGSIGFGAGEILVWVCPVYYRAASLKLAY